jgi:hypothetical protein
VIFALQTIPPPIPAPISPQPRANPFFMIFAELTAPLDRIFAESTAPLDAVRAAFSAEFPAAAPARSVLMKSGPGHRNQGGPYAKMIRS